MQFASQNNKIDLSQVLIDPALVAKVSPVFAMRHLVLPLSVVGGVIQVAMANPNDTVTIQQLRELLKSDVKVWLADIDALRKMLLQVYGENRTLITSGVNAQNLFEDPVNCVENILRVAFNRHASDIHFEPQRDGLRVRFRIDGELDEITHLPVSITAAVISRLKVLAGLDIAERRAPQDGAFTWQPTGNIAHPPVDIRLATLPVRYGERLTLRLLETDPQRFTLDKLGLSAGDRALFDGVLKSPHGLVLLTGPTGSGKTTTLYAAIQSLLSRRALNVLTVEDPIEYEIPGVSQAEVDSSDKVNFSKALKSLLRHDPDVIMIGEIRDSESLDTAVKAALTGHLVLSTLHTNDAVSAVTRLADMGLAPHLIAGTLRLVMAQRLVLSLCPHCRVAQIATDLEKATLGIDREKEVKLYHPVGCLHCAGRGYRGRVGLFELFIPDVECTRLIAQGVQGAELYAMARSKGMQTLLEDAREKCLAGITTWQWSVSTVH